MLNIQKPIDVTDRDNARRSCMKIIRKVFSEDYLSGIVDIFDKIPYSRY